VAGSELPALYIEREIGASSELIPDVGLLACSIAAEMATPHRSCAVSRAASSRVVDPVWTERAAAPYRRTGSSNFQHRVTSRVAHSVTLLAQRLRMAFDPIRTGCRMPLTHATVTRPARSVLASRPPLTPGAESHLARARAPLSVQTGPLATVSAPVSVLLKGAHHHSTTTPECHYSSPEARHGPRLGSTHGG